MKKPLIETITLEKIVGEGRALGRLSDGRKVFVWGGLPGETVAVQVNKLKSSYGEGVVTEVLQPSDQRTEPKDPESFLSTSPWQIMTFEAEQQYKSALIEEAFELHDIVLPHTITAKTDGQTYAYRNKVEFSFWWDNDREELDLAFFQRGSRGKVSVQGTSLARPEINNAAQAILKILRTVDIEGRNLKTLLIRCSQSGDVSAQLYIKDKPIASKLPQKLFESLGLHGFELIHSDYRSPASVITERLYRTGGSGLQDQILDAEFRYATEGFFQVNLPVYEMALQDMQRWILPDTDIIDMYSGVGTIGLTIGGDSPTLVEINDYAVQEMRRNVSERELNATIVHTSSETALEHIQPTQTVIVDPPRAGLHTDVIERLLETAPPRIIYLSCNPVTQARDVAMLSEKYGILAHIGYNFFPRTPHIEHLVILDLKQ